ncbi:MAG: universal stress protein [Actinobacteria bacterium]|nr:universal stress protein [Actinomycetota bacterium]
MHVMIATDGTLDTTKASDFVARLFTDGDTVTVYTVVEIPRGMLDEMRAAALDPADDKAREVGLEFRKTQAESVAPKHWAGDDAVVNRYVKARVTARTDDLVAALAANGVDAEVVGEEGENAAKSVLTAAKDRNIDVLCIGTHGHGRFEGLLGSLSTKLARLAPCSVVLIR